MQTQVEPRHSLVWSGKTAADCCRCGCRYKLPSQQHFYMEPQGALVLPDEAGTYTVTSSTQNIDIVQKAVAEVLALPMHKITADCCRIILG